MIKFFLLFRSTELTPKPAKAGIQQLFLSAGISKIIFLLSQE
ncbi:Uncharacterized protein dnm_048950 [Desulfonema magnum]|uniref:Uncharacterized protein n=1 Tax=Desulfonema magnum TaxID=45655 RepID=A0A975BPA1_9BACT|nr:Uncharacterized protein dnm_048950 [Desulfonema magnum]